MINSTLPQYVNTSQQEAHATKVEVCALGHPLGDCPARRAGCRNHYQLLDFMYPPLQVIAHVRATLGSDPAVHRWLSNLDAVLPGQRPTRGGWR